ncbi:MAG: GWxTD domain-containing protein [Bacteroidota bacterium]|nr:GWxTD domain-containing protein [Bacteroidota bacterium]
MCRKDRQHRQRIALPALFFLLCFLFCLPATFAQEREKEKLPEFQFDILSFQTSKYSADSARVDIYVAVPYSWLLFLNAGEKYVADYQVTLSIFSKGIDSAISRRVQPLTAIVPLAEWEKLHELDLTRADASQYPFVLKQGGEYELKIAIMDLTTHKEMTDSKPFTVLSFAPTTPSISDILLYKSKLGSRITPHIGADISSLKIDEAGIFCELYNAPQSVPFWLMQRISSIDDGEEIARDVSVLVSSGQKRMPVFLPFIQEDLWSGKYLLETFMLSDAKDTMISSSSALQSHALAYRSRKIEVSGVHGVPLAGLDLDDAIGQLAYIAIGEAYDSLFRAQTKQEKRRAIMDFWDKTNWYRGQRTTRPMEVFYRRVQYANEHFKGMGAGWRSDRGRVYIALGSPTSMDRHPYDANNRPYEVWNYYDLSQQYYFSDQFMMGDYRLMSSLPPNGTYLWQRESY